MKLNPYPKITSFFNVTHDEMLFKHSTHNIYDTIPYMAITCSSNSSIGST